MTRARSARPGEDVPRRRRRHDHASSTAWTSACSAGRWSRSSARAARARARCCTCSARSTPDARATCVIGGESHQRSRRTTSWRRCGTERSASCFSFITCCASSRALENVMMPLRIAGWDARRRGAGRDGAAGARGAERRACTTGRRAVGRRAAAHGGGARAGDRPGGGAGGRAVGQSRSRERRAAARPVRASWRATSRSGWSS